MNRNTLEHFVKDRRCTLLGVGPVSKNCVDATIELSNEYGIPLMLIASRRQVEMAELGGGYVNNWSTEKFAEYVIDHDKRGKIMLARDHGGPWQNPIEMSKKLSLKRAMEVAKKSFQVDIESGFDMIHIDPSIDIFNEPTVNETLERVFELYEFCHGVAKRVKREVLFEVGTDEQGVNIQDLDQFEYVLNEIIKFCKKHSFPRPTFIVAQTGTKVMEGRNVGAFDSPIRIENELPIEIQLPRIIEACQKYDIWLKEHNADFLSDESLGWHPKLGIHAANVAPEFGIVETKTILNILNANGLKSLSNEFVQMAYECRKWEKWLLPNSKTTDLDKACLAGHYVFATDKFLEFKKRCETELKKRGFDFDGMLKGEVKKSIFRYMKLFNLVGKEA